MSELSPDGKRMVRFSGKFLSAPWSSNDVSPDGNRIVTGFTDGTVRIWEASTGHVVHVMCGHSYSVQCVIFSRDGKRAASAALDDVVNVWDTESGANVQKLLVCTVIGMDFSSVSNGGSLALVCWQDRDKYVNWDSETGPTMDLDRWQDGYNYVTWDSETGQTTTQKFDNRGSFVYDVAFSEDGRRCASGSKDALVRIWNLNGGDDGLIVGRGHTGEVLEVDFSPDGKRLASTSKNDNYMCIWDTATGDRLLQIVCNEFISNVSFFADGKRVASMSHVNDLRVWDTATGNQLLEIRGYTYFLTDVPFSKGTILIKNDLNLRYSVRSSATQVLLGKGVIMDLVRIVCEYIDSIY